MAYYRQLRRLVHDRPELRGLLVRCRLCRIFFLTHPRNAGRCDLRCHFGCLSHDQARKSAERSADYYQSKLGKAKKRELNARRGEGQSGKASEVGPAPVSAPPRPEAAAEPDPVLVPAPPASPMVTTPLPAPEPADEPAEHALPPLVCYLATVLSLIELRSVMPREVAELLRQQGIALALLSLQYRRGRGRGPP